MYNLIKLKAHSTIIGAVLHHTKSQDDAMLLMENLITSIEPGSPEHILRSVLRFIQSSWNGCLSEDGGTRASEFYPAVRPSARSLRLDAETLLILGDGMYDAISLWNPAESTIDFDNSMLEFALWPIEIKATEWNEWGYTPNVKELPKLQKSHKELTGPIDLEAFHQLYLEVDKFPRIFVTSDGVVMSRQSDVGLVGSRAVREEANA